MNEQEDEAVQQIAEMLSPWVPALVTGVTGMTVATALALRGGVTGLLGTTVVLGLTGAVGSIMSEDVLERYLTVIYCQRRKLEPHDSLLMEIDKFWENVEDFGQLAAGFGFDPVAVKERLKAVVTDGCGCSTSADKKLFSETQEVVTILDQIPSITKASPRDFRHSEPLFQLRDGTTVKTWKNLLGVDHVFLADSNGRMLYGGNISWNNGEKLQQALIRIERDFT
ncbi:MAG: hypothetical protein AAGF26_08085 [Cyanobacteria bacterium P01_G01_bin.49]